MAWLPFVNGQEHRNYRLQNASRAFQVNREILCDNNVSITLRWIFFGAIVVSVVCFAAGHLKSMWVSYENVWMRSAKNYHGARLDHHRTLKKTHCIKFCMGGSSAHNNIWNVMDSNYGRIDIWRNTGIGKLFRLVAGKQVDPTCLGLAPTTRETWA